jgi:hypothetical protein
MGVGERMKLYRIKGWDKHYEKSQTRKVENAQWVPIPVSHDGKRFRRLMAMRDGPAIYGAWVLILQIAAKCPERGVLKDDDGPLTAEDMAIQTGCPQSAFERAIEVLSSQRVGWILVADWECDARPLDYRTIQDRTIQDRREQEVCPETASAVIEAAVLTFPTDGNLRSWDLTEAKVGEFREAFPSLDVVAECRKALAWVNANPSKRKTPRGMPGFLFRWLSRAQDRGGATTSAGKPELFRFGDDA